MGPQLGANLLNLGIEQAARAALAELGQDLDEVLACEEEPGLGNGGLGRLAACYLDSLATLARPAIGYGIRYEFGIFDQEIQDGWQVEKTDNWLDNGNPWEIAKPDVNYLVNWEGHTEHYTDDAGVSRIRWVPARVIKGVAYDTPIQGYGVKTCNVLTLWSARAVHEFALEAFNTGDYYKAVEEEVTSETVTKVLYPNDEPEAGKRLRLLQQYFFVSCSLQHVLHIVDDLARAFCHPAQRHSPLDRCRRAHAPAGRRTPAGLEHGLGHHRGHLRLHQPHPAAGGPGEVVAGDLRREPAPAPGDHLRDQQPVPGRGARQVPR
jgi:starch phosphorylase